MENKLEIVYLVKLQSTGETWDSYIAGSWDGVLRILRDKRITRAEDSMLDGIWYYRDPIDPSQSATVFRKRVSY